MTDLSYIRENTTIPERLVLLAEECSELSHACLKMRRALDKDASPTEIDAKAAEAMLQEEIADMLLCLQVVGGYLHEVVPIESVSTIMTKKKNRWAARIRDKKRYEGK